MKDKNGNVSELLSWQVLQRRYFDPTFGGAVMPGQRNVFLATEEITAYAFIAGPRNYSPIVSTLRIYPLHHFGVDWRTDYDPLLSGSAIKVSLPTFSGEISLRMSDIGS